MLGAVRSNLLRIGCCASTGTVACGNAECCLADTETFHGVRLSNPFPMYVSIVEYLPIGDISVTLQILAVPCERWPCVPSIYDTLSCTPLDETSTLVASVMLRASPPRLLHPQTMTSCVATL